MAEMKVAMRRIAGNNVNPCAQPRPARRNRPAIPEYLQDLEESEGGGEGPNAENPGLDLGWALDPERWSDISGTQHILHMEMLLTTFFAVDPQKKKDVATIRDSIKIATCIARCMGRAQVKDSDLITAGRTALKRAMLAKKAGEGRSSAYLEFFSDAVDQSAQPKWIRDAEKSAVDYAKNLGDSSTKFGSTSNFKKGERKTGSAPGKTWDKGAGKTA